MKRNGSSKLLTVIAMLVAGGLTFFGHRYWKAHPEVANEILGRIGVDVPQDEPADPEVTKDDLLKEMLAAEATMASCSATKADPQLVEDAARTLVRNLLALTDVQDDGPNDFVDEAMRIAHRGLFLATELDRSKFGDAFQKVNRKLRDNPANDDDAAFAKMLWFCYEHTFDRPLETDEKEDVEELATSFSNPSYGVTFVSLVSHQLVANGQKQEAKNLLERGMEIFPRRAERTRLVRVLIDQGHRPAPPPSITEAQWKTMVRIAESLECTSKFG